MAQRKKTGGRKKGTPNKTTAEIREKLTELLGDNLDALQKDIDSLKPIDRVKVLLELSKFVVPTLKATEITQAETKFTPIQIILNDRNK